MTPEVSVQAENNGRAPVGLRGQAVKPYDFRRPDKFSKDQLKAVNMIHDAFSRRMETVMTSLVREQVSAEVASVDQMVYYDVISALDNPTVLAVVELTPFNGAAFVEVSPGAAFAVIDRMLGGSGVFTGRPRELTEIEKTVYERAMAQVMALLDESWGTVADVHFKLKDLESNPFFVQICSQRDMVLRVVVTLMVGEVSGSLTLCIPYFLMEPIMGRLSSQRWFMPARNANEHDVRRELRRTLGSVTMPVSMELGSTVLSMSEVCALNVGDVIRLDQNADAHVNIRVGDAVRFHARPGTVRGRVAAEIMDVADTVGVYSPREEEN